MPKPTHRCECTAWGGTLYVSLELSRDTWLLTAAVRPDGRRRVVRVPAGQAGWLGKELGRVKAWFGLAADAPVRSCYEAGRDGFWPHRLLAALGVANLVVDSSSIEVPRRARRTKTDRVDGEQLLRLLCRHWSGERGVWQVVRVPSRAQEDGRQASRGLTTLTQERTRYRNRIRGLLAQQGVRTVVLAGDFPRWVRGVRDWEGQPLAPGLCARVVTTWRLLQAIEEMWAAARQAERAALAAPVTGVTQMARRLTRLRGVGPRSAMVLSQELFNRDVRNRRQLGALSGFVSAPYRSGARRLDQGLTRSGLVAVRRIGVQTAWAWLRYQPGSRLSGWYATRFSGGSAAVRKVGIVAVARRLLIALWRYATQAIVPAGAVVRAAA